MISPKPNRSSRGDLYEGSKQRQTSPPQSPVVATSVARTIAIEAGAIVDSAFATITARPCGTVNIPDVAEVRPGPSGSAIIDFGRMRTVTAVNVPDTTLTGLAAWQGAAFGASFIAGAHPGIGSTSFSEVLTERLRVDGTTADDLAGGQVTLPGGPTDLELLVAGKRVWFQAGEAKVAAIGTAPVAGGFAAKIDITDAVAAAAAAATKKSNGRAASIAVELRAATSGQLALDTSSVLARVYTVDFPGPQQVIDVAAEGTATLRLPLPDGAASWRVQGVALTASARLDALRVLPPVGPAASAAAELVLDLDHPLALQAADDAVAAFGAIAGVRVLARVDHGTAELGGALLADDSGAPGPQIPGGDLAPAQIAAGPAAWCTLSLRRPIAAPAGALWVALQTAHGTVALALADAGGDVRRGKPGGPWRGFSRGVAVVPKAALRLVGAAPDPRPIDALSAVIAGQGAQPFTPTADGLVVNLGVDPPIAPAAGALAIALTATAAASYRFRDVQIFYQLADEG